MQGHLSLFRVQHSTHSALYLSSSVTPSRAQRPSHGPYSQLIPAHNPHPTRLTFTKPHTRFTLTCTTHPQTHTLTHTSKCPGDKIIQIPGDWEPPRAEVVSFHPASEGLLSTYYVPGPKGSVGSTAGTVSPGAHMESSLLPVIKWILMKTRALLLSQGQLSVLQGRCYRLAQDKSVTIQPCEDSLRPGDAPSAGQAAVIFSGVVVARGSLDARAGETPRHHPASASV